MLLPSSPRLSWESEDDDGDKYSTEVKVYDLFEPTAIKTGFGILSGVIF